MESNKFYAAILVAGILAMIAIIGSGMLVAPVKLASPAYPIEGVVVETAPSASDKPTEIAPISGLLATADVDHGAKVAKQCQACHNFQEGQGPKVGPDLYNVVDRSIASSSGFNYSAALKSKAGDKWTFGLLNTWLTKPSAFAPGTAMTFAGISNEKQRADLIAYLDTLSSSPVPLPKAPAADAGAAPAPAK